MQKVYGFDQMFSTMKREEILSVFAPTANPPKCLKNHGLLEWLEFNKFIPSAKAVFEIIRKNSYNLYSSLTPSLQTKLCSTNCIIKKGKRTCTVHGALPNGELNNNQFSEAVNLRWTGPRGKEYPIANLGNNRTPFPLQILEGKQLAEHFNKMGTGNRHARMASEGIHFMPGNIFEDRFPNGQKSIWSDTWKEFIPKHVDPYCAKLKEDGVEFDSLTIDMEIKWWHAQIKLLGQTWIDLTRNDPRFPEYRDRLGFDIQDLARWATTDEKALRFSEINYHRTQEYQKVLCDIFLKYWPNMLIGHANEEYKVPSLYGTIRRTPFGVGGLPGNVCSLKVYGNTFYVDSATKEKVYFDSDWDKLCNEIRCLSGAIAASEYPLQVWPQDNDQNIFSTSPYGYEMLRHCCLLSNLPWCLSVEGSNPRLPILQELSNILKEVDVMCEDTIGMPLITDQFGYSGWYLLSGMDLGNKIIYRLSINPLVAADITSEQANGSFKLTYKDNSVIIPNAQMIFKFMGSFGCWLVAKK